MNELEKKLTDHNHGKYIVAPEFNTFAADVFNVRLAQGNLIKKRKLMLNCKVLTQKLFEKAENI